MKFALLWCKRRGLLIIISWIWILIGTFITAIIVAYFVEGLLLTDINSLMHLFMEKPYLTIYNELVAVGGLPLAISLLCQDNFESYGLKRVGFLKSISLAITFALVVIIIKFVSGGNPEYTHFNLPFPLNIIYSVLAILIFGPLEVFFVVWLIVNTDKVVKSKNDKIVSMGLLITVITFGFTHLIIAPYGGIINALKVMVEFLIFGLIFKYTKNSIGPMIAWPLINNWVQYLVMGCLT